MSFFENGSKNYMKFLEERDLEKGKKLPDIIKRIAMSQFLLKKSENHD